MEKFIDKIVQKWVESSTDFDDLIVILPSNRPKLFFRKSFQKYTQNTILPRFLSIDEFVNQISDLAVPSQLQLWFQAYESYKKVVEKPDEFANFIKWIPTLLNDFGDINSSLVSSKEIFDYLVSAERIKKWGQENLEIGSNKLMNNHLFFWKVAKKLFHQLNEDLSAKGQAYRGSIYKSAVDSLSNYLMNTNEHFAFVGLNALSNAERKIVFELHKIGRADLYWDSDKYYMEDENQESGHFLRSYKKELDNWNWTSDSFSQPKNINVSSISKRVGQAKYLHEILNQIPKQEWADTVVVLAEESILPAVLSSIPSKFSKVNITMGFPLGKSSMAYFFRSVFELQMNREKLGKGSLYYFRNVLDLLSNTIFLEQTDKARQLYQQVQTENRIFSTPQFLSTNLEGSIYQTLFQLPKDVKSFVDVLDNWIQELMQEGEIEINELDKEFLYRFSLLFSQLREEISQFKGINDFKTLHILYNQLLQNETISFVGEPLEGLQIVGLLETRLLDFKNVIMTSVNDGILPPGRVENSFIPYDIRREMNMNTFAENDAIFAYHFYRLLQRSKSTHLLYSSESDALGSGEKSRFITQMEIESNHPIHSEIISPDFEAPQKIEWIIEKTEAVIKALDNWVEKGISPSSLNNYLRDSITFYEQKVLGLKEVEEAEETVGARVLGNVVHETLEELYTPLAGRILIETDFDILFKQLDAVLEKYFKIHYKSGEFKSGKNLLIYKIAYSFVENVLKNDKKTAKESELVLVELEKEYEVDFELNTGKKVKLKGIIDRIDSVNGQKRVIDYKTGTVKEESLRIKYDKIASVFDDNKFDKPLQLLFYAHLFFAENENQNVQFGIYPLKFPKKEVLLLQIDGDNQFDEQIVTQSAEYLNDLIIEILNPEISFREKRVSRND